MKNNTQNETHQSKIINFIVSEIKNSHLEYGDSLPSENELAKTLGVSRGLIRESLKTLQYIGIIETSQGARYKVAHNPKNAFFSVSKLLFELNIYITQHISEVREALELKAVELIKRKTCISSEDIDYLQKCIDNMNNADTALRADMDFHLKIAEMCENPLICDFSQAMSQLSEMYILIPWVKLAEDSNLDVRLKLISAHQQLLDFIANNKTDLSIGFEFVRAHYKLADEIINKVNDIDNGFESVYNNIKNKIMSTQTDTCNVSISDLKTLINKLDELS